MRKNRKVYRVSVKKPERKRPLGRPGRRWENRTRVDIGEIGWGKVDWFG
jgi:hypothetical protein